MTDVDTDDSDTVEQCGEPTGDGTPCKQRVEGGGPCYLHDEDGPPDNHGAPKDNLNAATHMLYVERSKVFSAMEPYQQLHMLKIYEELIEKSVLDFDYDLKVHQMDCYDLPEDERPPTDENGIAYIQVPYPTEHEVRAQSLWHAAVDRHKMLMVSATLLENGMEREKTARSRYDSQNDEWHTLPKMDEHHLCLEYDRMIRRYNEHLKVGGVPTKPMKTTVEREDGGHYTKWR